MEQTVGRAVANICGSVMYSTTCEQPSTSFMKECVQQLYRINDVLRMRLVRTDAGEYMQEVTDDIPCDTEVKVFSKKEDFQQFAQVEAETPIPYMEKLSKFYIVRLPDSYGILVKFHHLIGDAWSLSLLADQMSQLLAGKTPVAFPYKKHLEKMMEYEKSSRMKKDLDFFQSLYQKSSGIILHEDSNPQNYRAKRLSYSLDKSIVDSMKKQVLEKHSSLFVFFLTAVSVYMSKTEMNADRFWVGTTLMNRRGREEALSLGMFVNTLPIPVTMEYEQSFDNNLKVMSDNTMQIMRHSLCTLSQILPELRKTSPELPRLYDVSVNYLNAQNGYQSADPLETHWYSNAVQTEALQIQIEDRDNTGILNIHYDYKESVFSEQQIERMHKSIMMIIRSALENGDIPLEHVRWLDEKEEERLNILAVNFKKWPFCPENMGSWFQRIAEADPDRIVLETSEGVLTYRELNEKSMIAATGLSRNGIRSGDTVGLALPRNSLLAVYILASIRIGAAFLAIDLEYPKDRIDFMLRDCQAVKCIDQHFAEALLRENEMDPEVLSGSLDNNCYCIYTSGSTGNPKGVIISQRNIVNNIFWRLHAYPDRNRRIICVTAVTADTFLEDFFYAVYSGNTFCFVEDRRNLSAIKQVVGDQNNNDIMTTPTFFRAIMKEVSLSHFKNVTLVGENIDSGLADEIVLAGVCLHNEYGPSECSVCDTHAILKDGDIHIGRPIDNAEIYILDRYLQPVPIGVRGELCIAGLPVGRGYIGRPEINKERFITDYKGRGPLYRTGDIAFWREDGNISIVGRADNQVKLRGLRIELDEIEKQINCLPGVTNSGVVVAKGKAGQQILCAFYTGEEKDNSKLTRELRKTLPDHMVPQIMIKLDALPMSQNGKVDKKKLELMDITEFDKVSTPSEPINGEERILCGIAGRLLQMDNYYPTSNFFHSGGDSLKAMQFVVAAEETGIRLNLQMLYNYPTVRELVEQLGLGLSNLPPLDTSDLEEINRFLAVQNLLPERTVTRETSEKDVLLTGVTGYLGIHILLEYLENSSKNVWCIIRGKNQDECIERMRGQLLFYGNKESINQIGKRIHVIKGDLTQPLLGTTADEYNMMMDQVGTVIHAAGNVKHYGLYDEFYASNVGSTSRLIDFCKSRKARFVYCSTTSIFMGAERREQPYSEQDFYVGQKLDNVYNRSKFEAERLIFKAVEDGLYAVVMRIGNLTNRNKDMLFQRNRESNAFWNRLQAFIESEVFPSSFEKMQFDLTPVDKAARVIRLLSDASYMNRYVYHIYSPKMFSASELFESVKLNGVKIRSVSNAEFEDVLRKSVKSGVSRNIAALSNDRGSNGIISIENENVSCGITEKYLNDIGFHWEDDCREYLNRYVKWNCKFKFVD